MSLFIRVAKSFLPIVKAVRDISCWIIWSKMICMKVFQTQTSNNLILIASSAASNKANHHSRNSVELVIKPEASPSLCQIFSRTELSTSVSLGVVTYNCISFRLCCTLLVAGQVIVFLKVWSIENSNLAGALKFRWRFKSYRELMLLVRDFAHTFPHTEKNVEF